MEGGAAEQPLEVNTGDTVVIDYFVRVKQRRMGTLVPKKLLSCRPRNDGPYDGPTIPSTPSQGSIDGGRGRHSARQYVGRVLSREVVEQ